MSNVFTNRKFQIGGAIIAVAIIGFLLTGNTNTNTAAAENTADVNTNTVAAENTATQTINTETSTATGTDNAVTTDGNNNTNNVQSGEETEEAGNTAE